VSLWDSNEKMLTRASDKLSATHQAHICLVDVADAEAVQRATEWTEQALGRVDILVANAGNYRP
jgi:NADP-dependent 3-hydroxy acid dehydrogenase YdfG